MTAVPVVAVDGPAASGKGTLARKLAAALGFDHLDTGAVYRSVGLAVIRAGGDPADREAAIAAARALRPGADVLSDPALRSDEIGNAASKVAVVPEVRAALLDFQRDFAVNPPGGRGAVLDGRDVGTVVCPDASVKLYIDASVEVRAERRLSELRERGIPAIWSDVLEDMRARDERDSRRAVAPLRPADDAFVVDTSILTADQVFDLAVERVRSRIGIGGRARSFPSEG